MDLSREASKEGDENDDRRGPGAGSTRDPGWSFCQSGSEGFEPAENTQGRLTADPRAAYTLVVSLDGWMIPVREGK